MSSGTAWTARSASSPGRRRASARPSPAGLPRRGRRASSSPAATPTRGAQVAARHQPKRTASGRISSQADFGNDRRLPAGHRRDRPPFGRVDVLVNAAGLDRARHHPRHHARTVRPHVRHQRARALFPDAGGDQLMIAKGIEGAICNIGSISRAGGPALHQRLLRLARAR